jgi:hypothetical protein
MGAVAEQWGELTDDDLLRSRVAVTSSWARSDTLRHYPRAADQVPGAAQATATCNRRLMP